MVLVLVPGLVYVRCTRGTCFAGFLCCGWVRRRRAVLCGLLSSPSRVVLYHIQHIPDLVLFWPVLWLFSMLLSCAIRLPLFTFP